MAGPKASSRHPTDLSKVCAIRQGTDENPAVFLEHLQEAFRIYIPYDPESQENAAAMTLAFINQSAPDIKRNLQRLEHLGEKSTRDLVKVAEKYIMERIVQKKRKLKRSSTRTNTSIMCCGLLLQNWGHTRDNCNA